MMRGEQGPLTRSHRRFVPTSVEARDLADLVGAIDTRARRHVALAEGARRATKILWGRA